ncbi:unnamed protein product [Mytilus coruscus]|uniref:Uncharacterized protein n=1 Tax=Mytilus coruscus TaxID=42192 RepID=A0A6J8E671_MYTCO|nr:unnamed protein product [Mytilus coruscus]
MNEMLLLLRSCITHPSDCDVIAGKIRENLIHIQQPVRDFYKENDMKKIKQRLREKFHRLTANRLKETDFEIRYVSKNDLCVKIGDGMTPCFKCCIGVRQGDVLSPNNCKIFINDLPEKFLSCPDPVDINNRKIDCLMYTDDVRKDLDVIHQMETKNVSSSFKCQQITDTRIRESVNHGAIASIEFDSDSSLPVQSLPGSSQILHSPNSEKRASSSQPVVNDCNRTFKPNVDKQVACPSSLNLDRDEDVDGDVRLMWGRKIAKECEKKSNRKFKKKKKHKSKRCDTKQLIDENEKMKNILKYLVKNKRKIIDNDSDSSSTSSSSD